MCLFVTFYLFFGQVIFYFFFPCDDGHIFPIAFSLMVVWFWTLYFWGAFQIAWHVQKEALGITIVKYKGDDITSVDHEVVGAREALY